MNKLNDKLIENEYERMTREEAIQLLVNVTYSEEWQGNEKLQTAHNMAIKALENERPKEKWIPVGERLPKVGQRVIFSLKNDEINIGKLHTYENDWAITLEPTGIRYVYSFDIVDAWMPLPEPYKEESEGGKGWIFTKTIFDKYGCTVECPSCHKKWKTYDEIRWKKENKFCPNCGAKNEDKR